MNLDGRVDGVDSALVQSVAPGSDVTGDGATDAADRQVMFANFGFLQNQGPQLASTLPSALTHQDLPVQVDLSQIAVDPDGDPVYYRIVSASQGTAALTAGGGSVWFTPAPGYTGPAFFELVSDDGFNSSAVALVPVTVSAAPLTSLDFNRRQIGIEPGHAVSVQVIGDFADQADVSLPFSYVNARTLDTSVAALTPEGALAGRAEGTTILVAERGLLTAATAVAVGAPVYEGGPIGYYFEIDAYPDSVALVPQGGSRQIIVSLGDDQEIFVGNADDGTRYFSGNTAVATVTPDGLIQAVAEGETTVTVIFADAEEVLKVRVDTPQVGTVVVNKEGGVVQNADGYSVAIGPGLLTGDATVSVSTLDEAELARAVPPVFDFVGAFRLDIDGSELQGPIQAAVPVDPAVAQSGDEVFFFREFQLPDENGDLQPYWVAVDSGVVDADGIARTGSPPFPGLSGRGNVLIARSNVGTMSIVRMEMEMPSEGAILIAMSTSISTMGIALMPLPLVAEIGFGLWDLFEISHEWPSLLMPSLVVTSPEAMDLKVWQLWADGNRYSTDITIPAPPPGISTLTVNISAPSELAPKNTPIVTKVDHVIDASGRVTLTIEGDWFYDPNVRPLDGKLYGETAEDARVVFEMGSRRVEVYETDFLSVEQLGGVVPHARITLEVPNEVLLGLSDIIVERPTILFDFDLNRAVPNLFWMGSQPVQVKNEGGFAFLGSGWIEGVGRAVEVIDTTRPDEFGVEQVVKRITLPAEFGNMDTVATRDLSQVFVATLDQGIAVIDATTLQQFDVDPDHQGVDMIQIPGDGVVTALALDPQDRYLYAAGSGCIYVIDLNPGSPDFHKVTQTIVGFDAPAEGGRINSLAVNADGTRLFAAVPDTMFAGIGWRDERKEGSIVVINVDEDDRPGLYEGNPYHWRWVIGELDGGVDPREIRATTDPNRLLFTSFLDTTKGLHTLVVTNDNPLQFRAEVRTIDLHINAKDIGTFGIYGYGWYGQYFDQDIWNAWGVAVTPDLSYAFVGDWHVAESIRFRDYSYGIDLEKTHGVGSKIGVVKDPFGLDPSGPGPTLLAATTPIPMTMLEDLEIDSSGKKLYANFRAAGNIAVYNLDGLVERAEFDLSDYSWKAWPLDLDAEQYAADNLIPVPLGYRSVASIPVNLQAIDTERWGSGLSVQPGFAGFTNFVDTSNDPYDANILFLDSTDQHGIDQSLQTLTIVNPAGNENDFVINVNVGSNDFLVLRGWSGDLVLPPGSSIPSGEVELYAGAENLFSGVILPIGGSLTLEFEARLPEVYLGNLTIEEVLLLNAELKVSMTPQRPYGTATGDLPIDEKVDLFYLVDAADAEPDDGYLDFANTLEHTTRKLWVKQEGQVDLGIINSDGNRFDVENDRDIVFNADVWSRKPFYGWLTLEDKEDGHDLGRVRVRGWSTPLQTAGLSLMELRASLQDLRFEYELWQINAARYPGHDPQGHTAGRYDTFANLFPLLIMGNHWSEFQRGLFDAFGRAQGEIRLVGTNVYGPFGNLRPLPCEGRLRCR